MGPVFHGFRADDMLAIDTKLHCVYKLSDVIPASVI